MKSTGLAATSIFGGLPPPASYPAGGPFIRHAQAGRTMGYHAFGILPELRSECSYCRTVASPEGESCHVCGAPHGA